MKKFLFLLLAVALSACAPMQQKTFNDVIDKIVVGKSTKDDIKALLGEPKSVTEGSVGNASRWMYVLQGSTSGNALQDAVFKSLTGAEGVRHEIGQMDFLIINFQNDVVANFQHKTDKSLSD